MTGKRFDVVTLGRSSIDLYSNDSGAPFPEITSFGAFVGGCPTNIAVGTRRLGLRVALVTGVGDDPVGAFVLRFLRNEGVETAHVLEKKGMRTAAVLLGIEPPDKFPLVFYRERPPDLEITIDDVLAAPVAETHVLVVTGTGLSRDPSRSATLFAMEQARAHGAKVVLDLDFRADQWHDARAFGVTVRSALSLVDIALGTEAEVKASQLGGRADVAVGAGMSSPEVAGDLDRAIAAILAAGPETLVLKRGAFGATIHVRDEAPEVVAPFPVDVVNVLGAGDAFASGFLYGLVRGWTSTKAARMGNATGAIVVGRQSCANAMPTEAEALAFVADRGGF